MCSAKEKAKEKVPGTVYGPDDLLYVTNGQAKEIRRYDLLGNPLGIFLDTVDLNMLPQSIQFGPNGDLYVLGTDQTGMQPLIKRFDGTDATYISTINLEVAYYTFPTYSGYLHNFFILVPEPTTIWLSVNLIAGVCLCRTRGRRTI